MSPEPVGSDGQLALLMEATPVLEQVRKVGGFLLGQGFWLPAILFVFIGRSRVEALGVG